MGNEIRIQISEIHSFVVNPFVIIHWITKKIPVNRKLLRNQSKISGGLSRAILVCLQLSNVATINYVTFLSPTNGDKGAGQGRVCRRLLLFELQGSLADRAKEQFFSTIRTKKHL